MNHSFYFFSGEFTPSVVNYTENLHVQDNLEKNIVDGSNHEEKLSKENRCTVQDHREASIIDENLEILQKILRFLMDMPVSRNFDNIS